MSEPEVVALSDAHPEQPMLVLSLGATEAICVVATYRWLMSQLVDPSETVLVVERRLAGVVEDAVRRLRFAGDPIAREPVVVETVEPASISAVLAAFRLSIEDGR